MRCGGRALGVRSREAPDGHGKAVPSWPRAPELARTRVEEGDAMRWEEEGLISFFSIW